jgi:hypothetical protein
LLISFFYYYFAPLGLHSLTFHNFYLPLVYLEFNSKNKLRGSKIIIARLNSYFTKLHRSDIFIPFCFYCIAPPLGIWLLFISFSYYHFAPLGLYSLTFHNFYLPLVYWISNSGNQLRRSKIIIGCSIRVLQSSVGAIFSYHFVFIVLHPLWGFGYYLFLFPIIILPLWGCIHCPFTILILLRSGRKVGKPIDLFKILNLSFDSFSLLTDCI